MLGLSKLTGNAGGAETRLGCDLRICHDSRGDGHCRFGERTEGDLDRKNAGSRFAGGKENRESGRRERRPPFHESSASLRITFRMVPRCGVQDWDRSRVDIVQPMPNFMDFGPHLVDAALFAFGESRSLRSVLGAVDWSETGEWHGIRHEKQLLGTAHFLDDQRYHRGSATGYAGQVADPSLGRD